MFVDETQSELTQYFIAVEQEQMLECSKAT